MMISDFTSRRPPDFLFSQLVLLLISTLASRLTGDISRLWMLEIYCSGGIFLDFVDFQKHEHLFNMAFRLCYGR